MFCGNCGQELRDGAKFCPSCGERTTAPIDVNEVVENGKDDTKSKNGNKIILIVGLLIVAMVGTLAVFVIKRNNLRGVEQEQVVADVTIREAFPDFALARGIAEALGHDSIDEYITQEELDEIETLASGTDMAAVETSKEGETHRKFDVYLKDNTVESLEGIQYCRNLSEVYLRQQGISDFSFLENMVKMERITIEGEKLEQEINLAVLKNMRELNCLRISDIEVENIAALGSLDKLIEVEMNRCNIESLKGIEKLSQLSVLWLMGNKISDLRPLAKLQNIQILVIMENQIVDIAPLGDMKNLISLEIDDNNIKDVTPLIQLPNLQYVSLIGNEVDNIDILYGVVEEIEY